MRFLAIHSRGAIMTDDYDKQEIKNNIHIKHLLKDIRIWNIKGTVTVFDENNKFVCKLNQRKVA